MTYTISTRSRPLAPGQFERITRALADPVRLALLEDIAGAQREDPRGGQSPGSPVTSRTASGDLEELIDAGLVETVIDGEFVDTRVVPGVAEAYAAELLRRAGGDGE